MTDKIDDENEIHDNDNDAPKESERSISLGNKKWPGKRNDEPREKSMNAGEKILRRRWNREHRLDVQSTDRPVCYPDPFSTADKFEWLKKQKKIGLISESEFQDMAERL